MDYVDRLNGVELLKQAIEGEVKARIVDKILKEHLDDFELKIKPRIEELVNSISFESFNLHSDHLNLRDELRMSIKWDDRQPVYEYLEVKKVIK